MIKRTMILVCLVFFSGLLLGQTNEPKSDTPSKKEQEEPVKEKQVEKNIEKRTTDKKVKTAERKDIKIEKRVRVLGRKPQPMNRSEKNNSEADSMDKPLKPTSERPKKMNKQKEKTPSKKKSKQ